MQQVIHQNKPQKPENKYLSTILKTSQPHVCMYVWLHQ